MKTMRNGSGLSVGSCVVLTTEYASLFEIVGVDTVTIHRVIDCRLSGGTYVFNVAIETADGMYLPESVREVYASDVRVVA